MDRNSLVQEVIYDVRAFLNAGIKEILFNERDFQMHLAMYLKETDKYDDVDLEYYVPWEELSYYPWKSEIRLDIVVMKDNEYLPIELKYKTKKIECSLSRFDEQLKAKYIVMKNQGAQNLGMYDYWKDVYRIEQVRKRFPNVKNGLAVFMTNDKSYLKASNKEANNFLFNMNEGVHGTKKAWKNTDAAIAQNRPDFVLEKDYYIHWEENEIENIIFHYCIAEI